MTRPPRCLVPDVDDEHPEPTAETRHHLGRVLRLGDGEVVEVVDGRGGCARARWSARGPLTVTERQPRQPPTATPVILAVAPPRLARLEWLVEKATELDVSSTVLVASARAERVPGPGRLTRLARKTDAAMLQCRRLHRMALVGPMNLDQCLQLHGTGEIWLGAPPDEDTPVRPIRPGHGPLLILVGPEGGFTASERERALQAGGSAVSFGSTVLRVETAAIALVVAASLSHP